ncbi:rod shape-determining protein MreD [Aerococcus kribbianus]|uniref:Rod shape-determining protein MreD n=1 Tax=Aerococcus kribbianus TaxID=2999064 RepID=A0A9X3FUX3_9LACT|nr:MULTISPECIES: rod shape-determining protein MreD [unclassified Aerococcus]MCZ0716684.1 rod shape-determining protein MreD [Aerococcus sp. YH-aer221]MCZ0724972.1 rod shape-determining protein MreD [Aerococcus sp. YH-aer222]
MLNYFKQHFLLPIILVFFLLFDGTLMILLTYSLNTVPYFISAASLIIALILFTLYLDQYRALYITAMVLGFIYDAYYTSILGVNLFAFPAIIMITAYIKKKIMLNLYSIWFIVIVMYSLYVHFIYLLYALLDIQADSVLEFWTIFYIPSLLFNGLLAFILIWAIRHLAAMINN